MSFPSKQESIEKQAAKPRHIVPNFTYNTSHSLLLFQEKKSKGRKHLSTGSLAVVFRHRILGVVPLIYSWLSLRGKNQHTTPLQMLRLFVSSCRRRWTPIFSRKQQLIFSKNLVHQELWPKPNQNHLHGHFLRHFTTTAGMSVNQNTGGDDDPLLREALNGNLESIAEIGRQYLDDERSGDQNEARRWLETAAELGHDESKFLLGILLVDKKTENNLQTEEVTIDTSSMETKAAAVLKEIREATKAARIARKERLLRKSKKPHHLPAEVTPPTDYEVGLDWLRQAARTDHGKAMCYLGNILLNGNHSNTTSDDSTLTRSDDAFEAMLWYERAASLNPPKPDALFNLGTLYFDGREGTITQDLEKSFSYFRRAADLQDISALFWVGHCYMSGEGGVARPDPELALHYLTKAADGGHSSAMYHLATLYRSGLSVDDVIFDQKNSTISQCHDHSHDHHHDHQHNTICADSESSSSSSSSSVVTANKELFFKYLNLAVEADDPDALYCLADMYMQGLEGLNKDETKGRQLVEMASTQGHAQATASLGAMYYHGHCGLQKDARKAFELYNIAAEAGSQEAWRNLAAMYYTGDGVPKSEDTAKEIMRVMFGVNYEGNPSPRVS